MKKYAFILFFSVFIMIFNACSTNKKTTNHHLLPEIKNATYTSYMLKNERGYDIEFTIDDNLNTQPFAVVFNKIKQNITPNNQKGKVYNVNVIATSGKIDNFKPTASNLPNGILFKINGTTYLKKVKFRKN